MEIETDNETLSDAIVTSRAIRETIEDVYNVLVLYAETDIEAPHRDKVCERCGILDNGAHVCPAAK
jgi:hypothetical protein